MNRWKRILALLLVCNMVILSGCSGSGKAENKAAEATTESEGKSAKKRDGDIVAKAEKKSSPLRDQDWIYEDDQEDKVVSMYLTVREGCEEENTNHVWDEINTYSTYYYEENDIDRYKVDGTLQIGDADGPKEGMFGYGETAPNVTVQVRGQTSSRRDQKNYKIRIKKGKGEYKGQRTIALNKHESDRIRFRNKLAYDLLKDIPQLMSARTQFVHLYVKDSSKDDHTDFEDYGLYTQVEQLNRTYLKNHGLDQKGHFYKVNFFEWLNYEPLMVNSNEENYDQKAFEQYLEVKGNADHTKLQEVIKAQMNYAIPVEELLENYFDEENLLYWMAFHMLIGNTDTVSRNLYLYSPTNSNKWYFLSWDMDSSLNRYELNLRDYSDGYSWERGLTQFLPIPIISRMMKEKKYRDRLDEVIENLKKNYLTEDILRKKVEKYRVVVLKHAYGSTFDREKMVNEESFLDIADNIPYEVERNYQIYQDTLKRPWPFFVILPKYDEKKNKMILSWNDSCDYRGEKVTYSYSLARDYNFENVIQQEDNIVALSAEVAKLEPGKYYLKVYSTNESGYTQDCYDYFAKNGGGKVYGCCGFRVDKKHKVKPYTVESEN